MRMILLFVISHWCHTPTLDLPALCLNRSWHRSAEKHTFLFKAQIRAADGLLYMIRADMREHIKRSIEMLQRCGTLRVGEILIIE